MCDATAGVRQLTAHDARQYHHDRLPTAARCAHCGEPLLPRPAAVLEVERLPETSRACLVGLDRFESCVVAAKRPEYAATGERVGLEVAEVVDALIGYASAQ